MIENCILHRQRCDTTFIVTNPGEPLGGKFSVSICTRSAYFQDMGKCCIMRTASHCFVILVESHRDRRTIRRLHFSGSNLVLHVQVSQAKSARLGLVAASLTIFKLEQNLRFLVGTAANSSLQLSVMPSTNVEDRKNKRDANVLTNRYSYTRVCIIRQYKCYVLHRMSPVPIRMKLVSRNAA